MVLNILSVDSSVEVFCGVFDNKLGDSVQYEDKEEQLKVSGFLSSPPTSRAFSAVSCTRRSMTCSGRSRLESIYKILLSLCSTTGVVSSVL